MTSATPAARLPTRRGRDVNRGRGLVGYSLDFMNRGGDIREPPGRLAPIPDMNNPLAAVPDNAPTLKPLSVIGELTHPPV